MQHSVVSAQGSGSSVRRSAFGVPDTHTVLRWLRFNAVGALGMVVQLAVLAGLNRMTSHYLMATAVAIEITLLHNFAWHVQYTWRDRAADGGRWGQLVRFHLSNGAVSMAGNLAMMPLLVRGAGMPVLAANAVAVVVCSVVNFLLGDGWVFGGQRSALSAQRSVARQLSHEGRRLGPN